MAELPDNPAARVSWVIRAPDPKEMQRRYDLWARQYDGDLGSAEDYLAPMAVAAVAKSVLTPDACILDAGAGTGLAGAALKSVGFYDLVAVDYSSGMLEIAAKKSIYRRTLQADLSTRTSFADGSFDAVVSVGTISQVPATSFNEYVRVVRGGGHILLTVWPAAYVERGYADIQRAFEAQGRLRLIQKGDSFQPLPTSEPDIEYQIWVFEVQV